MMIWATIVTAVVVGGAVQGLTGFGFGLLTVPTFGMFMPGHLPQIVLLISAPSVLAVVCQEWMAIDWGAVGRIFAGRIVGTMPGMAVVVFLPPILLGASFALITLAACASLAAEKLSVEPTKPRELVAGGLSGFMATAAALGGPPVALLYAGSRIGELRAIMATTLLFGNGVSLFALIFVGRMHWYDVHLALLLLAPLAVGFVIGNSIGKRVDSGRLRPFVLWLISVNAMILLVRSLTVL